MLRHTAACKNSSVSHYPDRDLKQFIAYWKKNPTEVDIFKNHSFLFGVLFGFLEEGKIHRCLKPSQLCLDDPYEKTGLAEFSKIHNKSAVWDGYKGNLSKSQLEDFVAFLKEIGVMHDLRIERVSTDDNPYAKDLRKDYHQYGVKKTCTAIDEDHSISGIDEYLAKQSVLANRLIWRALIGADRRSATARFRPNQQYLIRKSKSQLVCHLMQQAWIPDKKGVFRKPEDMTKDDLRTDFPYDDRNGLLTAIGFGERAKKRSEEYRARNEVAKQWGFDSAEEAEELAKLLSETGKTPEELRSLVSQHKHASQPEESVPNPKRRRKGVLERKDNAPTRENVTREQTIQPGAKQETLEARAYLRAKYKNAEGQLICQCCHDEMPFKAGCLTKLAEGAEGL